ncbi:MAG: amidohydrolase family protein [Planctomycetes bacterium]|nr:amidohydrolase family protein [Planctomycetota bacterium]
MIVDTHTHLWQSVDQLGPQISAKLRQRFPVPNERLDAGTAAHEAAMAPVNVAFVLGFRSVLLEADVPPSLISHYVNTQRDKLIGFAGIDPLDPAWSDQMDQLGALKLSGIVISPAAQGFHPTHSRAMKLYDRAQSLGLPIIVHQGSFYTRDTRMEYAQPYLLDEVARSFPQLRLLIAHCGHPWTDQALALVGKHRYVYAEVSDVAARPWQLYQVLLQAHQMDVIDRVLFGSDFPQQSPQQVVETIYSINQFAQGTALPAVPREKLRAIVERDALSLLGLKRGAASESSASTTMPPITTATGPRPGVTAASNSNREAGA